MYIYIHIIYIYIHIYIYTYNIHIYTFKIYIYIHIIYIYIHIYIHIIYIYIYLHCAWHTHTETHLDDGVGWGNGSGDGFAVMLLALWSLCQMILGALAVAKGNKEVYSTLQIICVCVCQLSSLLGICACQPAEWTAKCNSLLLWHEVLLKPAIVDVWVGGHNHATTQSWLSALNVCRCFLCCVVLLGKLLWNYQA